MKKLNKLDIIGLITNILALCIGIITLTICSINITSFEIASTSMEPTLHMGNIAVVKKLNNIDSLKAGDIICYRDIKSKIVIHRIVNIYNNENNEVIIETKGDNNSKIDMEHVTDDNIIGKFITQVNLRLVTSILISIGVFFVLISIIKIPKQ